MAENTNFERPLKIVVQFSMFYLTKKTEGIMQSELKAPLRKIIGQSPTSREQV